MKLTNKKIMTMTIRFEKIPITVKSKGRVIIFTVYMSGMSIFVCSTVALQVRNNGPVDLDYIIVIKKFT